MTAILKNLKYTYLRPTDLLIVTVIITLFLSGCATTTPTPTIHTHIVGDWSPRDNFRTDEAINLTVYGYQGNTVTFRIQDVATGSIVYTRDGYIPKEWNGLTGTVGKLPKGFYYAYVLIKGEVIAGWKFAVQ